VEARFGLRRFAVSLLSVIAQSLQMPILLSLGLGPLKDIHGAEIATHLPIREGQNFFAGEYKNVLIIFTERFVSTFIM
jgi:hypothetical protein